MLFVSAEADVLVSVDPSEPYGHRKDMTSDNAVTKKATFASGKTAEEASVCGRLGSFEVFWDYSQHLKSRPQLNVGA